eukprot:364914-Chlamydomonas_euryale.AAC.4
MAAEREPPPPSQDQPKQTLTNRSSKRLEGKYTSSLVSGSWCPPPSPSTKQPDSTEFLSQHFTTCWLVVGWQPHNGASGKFMSACPHGPQTDKEGKPI